MRMRLAIRHLVQRQWPAWSIFFLSLAMYVRTLCPTVFVEGTGENIVAAWTLGVPHPPGFPLFCLLAKAFAVLAPVAEAAYRINLFAAVMGALATVLLYRVLRTASLRGPAAAAAALTFAFSSTFWRQATIAEVYTLSFVFICVQFACLLQWRASLPKPVLPASPTRKKARVADAPPHPNDRALLWFALAFGLGLAVHYHHLLLLPGYLVFILASDRTVLRRMRTLAYSFLLTLAGFSLHLYAPLRSLANPPLDWGNPQSLPAWWRYLTAEQYRGRMFHLPAREVLANFLAFVRDIPHEFWWLGLAVTVLGAGVIVRRDRKLLLATAVIFLTALLWAINYNIPWEIDVYYLPALFVLALWMGFGAQWLLERTSARLAPVAIYGLFLLPLLALITNFNTNNLSEQRFVLDNGLDILDQLPPRAILLLPSTNPTFVLLYLTEVEHRGPGLRLWSRLERGVATVQEAVYPADQVTLQPEARFVSEHLAKGEPVFAIERQTQSQLPGIAQLPWLCMYQLVPEEQREHYARTVPDPTTVMWHFDPEHQQFRYGMEHRLLTTRYLLVRGDYLYDQGASNQAEQCYQHALRIGEEESGVVIQVAQRYRDHDQLDAAADLYVRALTREAKNAELHNRLGAIYGQQGKLEEAKAQFLTALHLKPELAEAHANLASIYGRNGDLTEAARELELALQYDPSHFTALKNLSFAYLQLGRPEKARPLLQRAATLDPADVQVQALLEQLNTH